jgi:hypothetical protein
MLKHLKTPKTLILKISRMWNVGAMVSVLITSFGDIMYHPKLGVF